MSAGVVASAAAPAPGFPGECAVLVAESSHPQPVLQSLAPIRSEHLTGRYRLPKLNAGKGRG